MAASLYDDDSRRLLDEAHKAPYLEKGEDRKLALLARAGGSEGEKARTRLIASHQRLVVSIAKQYLKSGKPLSELISDGKIGLLQAANKYDPDRGNSFATVANWWIRAAIQNSALGADDSADLPPSTKRKLFKIQQAERAFVETGEDATDAAIATKLKLSPVTVHRLREAAPKVAIPTASLDQVVGDGTTTFGDLLVDTSSVDPLEALQQADLKQVLEAAMTDLDERERLILSMRFGLVDDEEATLRETGDLCDISPERVRQIEKRALRKIAAGPHCGLLRSIMRSI